MLRPSPDRPAWRFTLAALATWRVTHLIVEEDGPSELVVRLRLRAGNGQLGALMDCFYCTSVWVALPIAVGLTSERAARAPRARAMSSRPAVWARRSVAWLALSGAACLLEQATRPREAPYGPQEVEALP